MMTLENQPSMPTADTKTRCPTTEELQRYLAGWLVENRSIEIESHLSQCSACEPRVLELEAASDPLLAGLRDRMAPPGLSAESRVDLRSGDPERVAGDNHPADADSDSDPAGDADAKWIAAVSDEIGQREDGSSEATRASWRPPAEGFGAYELLRPLARTVGATHHFPARTVGATHQFPARTVGATHQFPTRTVGATHHTQCRQTTPPPLGGSHSTISSPFIIGQWPETCTGTDNARGPAGPGW